MSWSDDMRCLYCDGKLPLYRKITSGQFCSSAHRKAYWQEQERLAVERLHQTHNSLKAYRPPAPPESILGPLPEATATEAPKNELSGFASTHLVPYANAESVFLLGDRFSYDVEQPAGQPVLSTLSGIGMHLPEAGFSPEMTLARVNLISNHPWAAPTVTQGASPESAEWTPPSTMVLCRPAGRFEPSAAIPLAKGLAVSLPGVASQLAPVSSTEVYPLAGSTTHPASGLCLDVKPVAVNVEELREDEIPHAEDLFNLKQPVAKQPPQLAHAEPGAPEIPAAAACLPSYEIATPAIGHLSETGLAGLPAPQHQVFEAAPPPSVESLALAGPQAPQLMALHLAIAANHQPHMTGGIPYAVQSKAGEIHPVQAGAADLLIMPSDVALPYRHADAAAPFEQQPSELCGLQSLPAELNPADSAFGPHISPMSDIPQPLRSETVIPAARLEPMDSKPPSDYLENLPASRVSALWSRAQNANPWVHAVDFWRNAPRDLKILAIAIPALLALVFHPALPKVHLAAPAPTSSLGQGVKTAVNEQWTSMKQAVFDRAAVALDDDFRTGLDQWTSRGDRTTEWSFDATGFVRPSALALYRPSVGLTDYQMQFLGMIDRKALSWVVRAADFDNYYVLKLMVLKPGPLTSLGITRYAVINGKAQDRVDTVVPLTARPDMLYRVRVDIHEDSFALALQGQMIDTWSEPRLRRGGIGFFSSRGEESRVRWVQVTHQYDVLGRLCAYLAPYDIPSPNGSW